MLIITGASGGIGHQLMDMAHAHGHRVLGTYHRSPPQVDIESFKRLDVCDEEAVAALAKSVAETKPDQLSIVHCPGLAVNGVVHKTELQDWDAQFNVNLKSAFLLAKHFMPLMREIGHGRFIFCSSVAPVVGVPGTAAYSASKAGLWGLSRTLAKEGALKGVTSNCLNIGYMNAGMIEAVPENILKGIVETIPMKRLGHVANIWNAVNFLIHSDYVSGTEITIAGGLT